jgi:hypothetical protein
MGKVRAFPDLRAILCASKDPTGELWRNPMNPVVQSAPRKRKTASKTSSQGLSGPHYKLGGKLAQQSGDGEKPNWNAHLHQLTFRGTLVKWFRQPAEAQETILAAFEELAWPGFIDDPLPKKPDQDPKQRLRKTVGNLNRRTTPNTILFYMNGRGNGACWKAVE